MLRLGVPHFRQRPQDFVRRLEVAPRIGSVAGLETGLGRAGCQEP